MTTFCPATMCPLFARDGSPWTGDKNSPCPQKGGMKRGCCAWWQGFGGTGCDGATSATMQVLEAVATGRALQVGPIQMQRPTAAPRTYDCPRAHECQWQQEAGDGLCPPRLALSAGVDPKACAY